MKDRRVRLACRIADVAASLDERNRHPQAGELASDSAAHDPSADDDDVEIRLRAWVTHEPASGMTRSIAARHDAR